MGEGIFKVFPNSKDWNMALIFIRDGWGIGNIKATFGIYMGNIILKNSPNVSTR